MGTRRKKPQKGSHEGALLLAVLLTVLLFVCSLLFQRHPAGAVLAPLQNGTTIE